MSKQQSLLTFIKASPTPFHAVETMAKKFNEAGYIELFEEKSWALEKQRHYFVRRNQSSIIAFHTGHGDYAKSGWRMVGAHTDSPCLKIKPNPNLNQQGYLQLGVEVYGGVLLNPWFDRDLSIAGRVCVETQGKLKHHLIDFIRPIAVIPSLAIHLDRKANEQRSINPQTDIPPILALTKTHLNFEKILLNELHTKGYDAEAILDYELYFYDTQDSAIIGLENEFIASARLDNLLSCQVGLEALLACKSDDQPSLLICNDHEEVGSQSAAGADGSFLKDTLERIHPSLDVEKRALAVSMMVSTDNAHAIHPNYSDRHDKNHAPKINAGPVIKINANQRYATNSQTAALFRLLGKHLNLPLQCFTVRTDMGCGSTIGPISAAQLGLRTLDIGVPTFAMHSIRELAGTEDRQSLEKLLRAFYQLKSLDRIMP